MSFLKPLKCWVCGRPAQFLIRTGLVCREHYEHLLEKAP
jgi:hypothetical protein